MSEERIRKLETDFAVLNQKLNSSIETDKSFRQKVVDDLDYLKEQNIISNEHHKNRDELIERLLEREKAKSDFWLELRERLAFAGIWGVVVILAYISWYAFVNFIKGGGSGT